MDEQDPGPAASRAWRRPSRALVAGAMGTALLTGGAVLALSSGRAAPPALAGRAHVAVPTAAVVGLSAGRVPWNQPLRVAVTSGTLAGLTATAPGGGAVAGAPTPTGWRSSSTLLPSATYRIVAAVRDSAGALHTLPLTAVTAPATQLLRAALSPGDDAVVGVGKVVEVRLDRDVTDPAARAAVVARLTVQARPAVRGAWRWMDARTVHYRPESFWEPGTRVSAKVDLSALALPGGVWGSGSRTTSFTVGDALISTVDASAHTMTVRRNGAVLRVLKASMGRPEFATRNGTFVVLEKFRHRIMDSATVNLPPGTPAYRTAVEHAVRITNSGTFTHGAPWSVSDQGVRNVSHGCINLSPADAAWFYDLTRRGDVVKVVNSTREANAYDAGSRDWIRSFADWQRP